MGEETAARITADVPDDGFDLVIMNPPFTSNTAKEADRIGKFAPAFAAFNSREADQRAMSKRMGTLKKGTCYHGHAGMASAFAALGHRKLKVGGTLALVMPLTVASASSWKAFRDMLAYGYSDLNVISLAAYRKGMSFSSDTGMSECLVVARKAHMTTSHKESQPQIRFTSLPRRPRGILEANLTASRIAECEDVRQIENGPNGGTRLTIGDDLIGEAVNAPCDDQSSDWGSVRITDYSLAQTAYALSQSSLWLPGISTALDLETTSLGKLASLGKYDLDIIGKLPQGPFDKLDASPTATYPSLWNHNRKNETRIVCDPDSQLQIRQGMETKATVVWKTASRSHINREFTFGSQPLAVAFTDRNSIGGRVWPNVIFEDNRFDFAIAVWGNSTLGLLCHWWNSSRQQSSKASMSITSAKNLPTLDLRALTNAQLTTAQAIFDDFRERELMPAYLADADPNRALLDKRVLCELLGFDEDVYRATRLLSAKWCAEPSVHGGKRRPRGAELVV